MNQIARKISKRRLEEIKRSREIDAARAQQSLDRAVSDSEATLTSTDKHRAYAILAMQQAAEEGVEYMRWVTDGDLVCIGPGLQPENGELVVAIVNGDAHLRRLRKVGAQILLASDDEAMELTPADEAQIIGPVLWARHYYRK